VEGEKEEEKEEEKEDVGVVTEDRFFFDTWVMNEVSGSGGEKDEA
jgi:hypothetical protein